MNLAAVMDEVANRLDGIAGLRVFGHPEAEVTPPAAIVSLPDSYTFDATYGRGMDRMTLQVLLVVRLVSDRSSRDELAAYCDGSGARSVKQVLESATHTTFDTVRVVGIDFDTFRLAEATYTGAVFELDIAGPGSS
jgi:hypothetical protein